MELISGVQMKFFIFCASRRFRTSKITSVMDFIINLFWVVEKGMFNVDLKGIEMFKVLHFSLLKLILVNKIQTLIIHISYLSYPS